MENAPLKRNAIGYASSVVIGVASTAPGYSLAAVLGLIVAVGGVGVHAPGVLIVSFVPMLLVALGYKYMNRAEIAGLYSFLLFGVHHPSTLAVTAVGVVWIAIMTAICVIGVEVNARTQ